MRVEYSDNKKKAYFDDVSFTRDDKTGYYLSTHRIDGRRIRLHVYVWSYYNGEIPKGCQIHHKDENKYHNDIDNLECMTEHDHLSLHSSDPEHIEKAMSSLPKAREAAKEWHHSEDGYEWHKAHYEKMKDKLHIPQEFTCLYCGKRFTSTRPGSKYCCNNHRAYDRRKNGVDNVKAICVICGKPFVKNKYEKAKTCGPACRGKLRSARCKGLINE